MTLNTYKLRPTARRRRAFQARSRRNPRPRHALQSLTVYERLRNVDGARPDHKKAAVRPRRSAPMRMAALYVVLNCLFLTYPAGCKKSPPQGKTQPAGRPILREEDHSRKAPSPLAAGAAPATTPVAESPQNKPSNPPPSTQAPDAVPPESDQASSLVEETSDKERSSPEPAFETISNETVFEELTLGMSMEDVRKLHPTASVGGGARVKNVISTLPDGRSIVAKFLDGRLGIIVAKTKVKAGDAAEVDAAFQRALAVHAKRFGMPPPGGVGKKSMIWTEGNISLMVRKDEKFGEVIEEFRDVTASVQIRNIENR